MCKFSGTASGSRPGPPRPGEAGGRAREGRRHVPQDYRDVRGREEQVRRRKDRLPTTNGRLNLERRREQQCGKVCQSVAASFVERERGDLSTSRMGCLGEFCGIKN